MRGGFAANRAYGNQRLPYAKLVSLPPRHDLRPEHRADGACLLQPQLALQRLHGLARRGAEHTVRRDERDAPARAGGSIPLIAADGVFGPATREAVQALQRQLGLEETGAVGPVLWAEIMTRGQGY